MSLGLLWVLLVDVRVADSQRPAAPITPGSVAGVVHDSLSGTPLAGASVQLVGADTSSRFGRTEVSDSLGRFSFADVPKGQFTLGFFHPLLDSLGLEPMLRSVTVIEGRSLRADLAIPSAARLRESICGSADSASTIVMGFLRNAQDGMPIVGGTVMGSWDELAVERAGVVRRTSTRTMTTATTGWFALCGFAKPGPMSLRASGGGDTTDVMDVQVPAGGVLRIQLFLGPARTILVRDSAREASEPQFDPGTRRIRIGEGVLHGTVVSAVGGYPLPSARVGIVDGPQTRANARGEWTLTNAPPGSRMLEVRALGYYPAWQRVDVVPGAPTQRVALAELQSVLDTMKVVASYDRGGNLDAFRQRSRAGLGRFLTPADIARHQPLVASDVIRGVPGIILVYPRGIDQDIYMRGVFEDRCRPAIFLNGSVMRGLTTFDLDSFVAPGDIAGMEVYAIGQAPPQFQVGLSGCGTIVIWTR